MKILFFSDLHGDEEACSKILDLDKQENYDYVVSSGDFLYHGPRNSIKGDYDPAKVFVMLNTIKEKMVCARGNCDSEVDQCVLEFPISEESTILNADNKRFFITHGHIYFMGRLPDFLKKGDIFVQGHTHIATLEEKDGIVILNPGSCSLPRGKDDASYATYVDGLIEIKELATGKTLYSKKIS